MTLHAKKISGLANLDLYLKGGVDGSKKLQGVIFGLNGKTVKTKLPGVKSVALADVTEGGLTLRQIIDQINAGLDVGVVQAVAINGHLALVEVAPSGGVTIDKTGTANSILGFDAAVDMVGTFYGPLGGGAPQLVSAMPVTNDVYLVVTDE